MISSRPSMNLEVRRDFVKRANAVLIAAERHVAADSCCRICVAHRTTDDKAAMSAAGGRRSALARVNLCVFRSWHKTRRPTGGRTKAAAAGSVVGGGALRAVVLSGRGCIKVHFFLFRHAAPRNQHPRKWGSSRRLREIDPRLAGSSLGSATNSAEPPSIGSDEARELGGAVQCPGQSPDFHIHQAPPAPAAFGRWPFPLVGDRCT